MIARLAALFAGFAAAHGTHGQPVKNGLKWEIKPPSGKNDAVHYAETIRKPVTLELWAKHVAGERPLGIIPIKEDNTCSWGSVDVDEYDTNLLAIVERVEKSRFPLVPCRSKSGGLHLFLFLLKPLAASVIQGALREMAASLGLAGSEIFPKQTTVLANKGGLGNWMVMPYFGGTFGGKLREQVGIRKVGAELTLGEFCSIAEKARVTEEELADAIAHAPGTEGSHSAPGQKGSRSTKRANGGTASRGPFGDGPPCLQHMARGGFPEGGRNKALLHMGVYFKKSGAQDWEGLLGKANHQYMKPPLPASEVSGVIASLRKKDYEYLCKEEPMCSHCDAILCRTRKFGVGGGGAVPLITGISKLDITPPIWFVDVEGESIECSTEQLQNYQKFHALCMSELNRCYRGIKNDAWYGLVSAALANVNLIPAPPDASTPGRFQELLEDFCTDRARGEKKEDLLTGRPWLDEETGRHYFRLRDLDQFFRREGVRDMTRGQMTRHIRNLEGEPHFLNLKGKGVAAWWVPARALAVSPPVDPPSSKEEKEI
jgi:hypothetical protein